MSVNHPALEAGIVEALSEPGSVPIGWLVIAAYRSPEQNNGTGYFVDHMDGMPYHSVLGLIEVLRQRSTPTEAD